MEQVDSINFSSIIASSLLYKDRVSSVELVNYCSKIESNFDVEIIDDDIDYLFECVDMGNDASFYIKTNLGYESVLTCGETVYDFLWNNSLPFYINNQIFNNEKKVCKVVNVSPKSNLFKANKRLLLRRV